jgi:nucleoside-diphosphate-sugar epimerase
LNILITGGAGYKGIKLTTKLLNEGYDVTLLDNFMYGYEPILHLVENKKLTILKQDIRNPISDLHKYDAIFHLAGISGFPACAANPNSAVLINVEATKQLVSMISKNQIFINASTTSMYGKSGKPCNEDTPIDPVSTYAQTKYEAEKIVQQKENTISLRFATVFGLSPRMRMDLMVNDFTYRAIKEGALVLFDSFAKRTFIHIDDAVDCYLFTLNNYDSMKGGVYNAGGDHLNYSKKDIANLIKQKIEYTIVDSDMKDKDLRHFTVNYEKIRTIGYTPKLTVEDGIDHLIKAFTFYEYYSHFKTI